MAHFLTMHSAQNWALHNRLHFYQSDDRANLPRDNHGDELTGPPTRQLP